MRSGHFVAAEQREGITRRFADVWAIRAETSQHFMYIQCIYGNNKSLPFELHADIAIARR